MRLLLACFLCFTAWGQQATPVNQVATAPPLATQTVLVYSGTNLTYQCITRSIQPNARSVTVSTATNASPVVFTATAHGFDYQSLATTTPAIKIVGATGGWTGINGVWVATPTSANAFSIAVDSTAFGAWGAQSVAVTTYAPSLAAKVWSIFALVYDATGKLIWSGWGSEVGGAAATNLPGGATAANLACSSRTSYSYQ